MKKMFKILALNSNCVLLQKLNSPYYKVRDIENEDIYIGYDYDKAKSIFETYDIHKVREERKKLFEQFIKDFAQA